MFKKESLIRQKTVGETLRGTRQAQRKTIQDFSRTLKIPVPYLEALEKGRYNNLPSPVYIKNYLRLYAKELKIHWSLIEKQYEREIRVYQQLHPSRERSLIKNKPVKPTPVGGDVQVHHQQPLMIMRLLKMGGAILVTVLAAVYLGTQLLQLLQPPELLVTEPAQDVIVTEHKITIVGKTTPEAIVEINGQSISVEPDGKFTEDVPLHRGLNTIRISAKSKLSRHRQLVRNVLYNEEEEETTEEEQNN